MLGDARSGPRTAPAHALTSLLSRAGYERGISTYLRASVRGTFYYLYLTLDIFSRKMVATDVHVEESAQLAGPIVEAACVREHVNPKRLTLHADNGGPMKGSTMLATLQQLGVARLFQRFSGSAVQR